MPFFVWPYQQSADPILPDVTVDSWRPEDNQPPRGRALAIALLAGLTYVGEPIAPPTDLGHVGWLAPLSEPTLPAPSVAHQQAFTDDYDALARPEDVKLTSWYADFSVPVLPRPRTAESYFAFIRDVEAFDTTWLRALEEPTLPAPAIAHQQSETVDPDAFTRAEDVKLSSWYSQFATPVIVPRLLDIVELTFVEDFVAPAPVIDWLRALETPTLAPVPVADQQTRTVEFETPLFVFDWLRQLEGPPQAAPRVADQPAFAFVEDFIAPAPSIDWLRQLELPPTAARRTVEFPLPAFVEESGALGPAPAIQYALLETPPRAAKPIVWQQALASAEHLIPRFIPPLDSWHRPLDNPTLPRMRVASTLPGPFPFDPAGFPVPPTPPNTKTWTGETAVSGAWIAEASQAGSWTPEAGVADDWTEEDPTC